MLAASTSGEDAPGTPPKPVAVMSTDGRFLVREDEDIVYDDAGKAFDAHSGQPLELGQDDTLSVCSPGIATADTQRQVKGFKARPLPSSTKTATIKPRLSKAAALRMGVAIPEAPKREMARSSTTSSSKGPVGISGLPRSTVEVPKSLQAPSIAPRLNRAATARTKGEAEVGSSGSGGGVTSEAKRERKLVDYSNTPGHKRQSLQPSQLASLAAPAVAPRLNKAATARLSDWGTRDAAAAAASSVSGTNTTLASESMSSRSSVSNAPFSPVRKLVDFSNTPGHKRASVGGASMIKSLQAPSVVPRGNRVSQGRLSVASGVSSPVQSRAGATKTSGSSSITTSSSNMTGKENRSRQQVDYSNTPGHKRSSMMGGTIASLAQPTIAPRTNTATMKRLSMGSNNLKGRPSLDGQMKNTSALRASLQSNRPSSRSSMSGARQDGPVVARTTLRSSAAPPSSFRLR